MKYTYEQNIQFINRWLPESRNICELAYLDKKLIANLYFSGSNRLDDILIDGGVGYVVYDQKQCLYVGQTYSITKRFMRHYYDKTSSIHEYIRFQWESLRVEVYKSSYCIDALEAGLYIYKYPVLLSQALTAPYVPTKARAKRPRTQQRTRHIY